jgi:hypothetical protein
VATRRDLPLRLHQLRLAGKLAEIRAAQLRRLRRCCAPSRPGSARTSPGWPWCTRSLTSTSSASARRPRTWTWPGHTPPRPRPTGSRGSQMGSHQRPMQDHMSLLRCSIPAVHQESSYVQPHRPARETSFASGGSGFRSPSLTKITARWRRSCPSPRLRR